MNTDKSLSTVLCDAYLISYKSDIFTTNVYIFNAACHILLKK